MNIRYFVMNPTGNRTLLMEQPEDGSSLRESVWSLAADTLIKQLPGIEQAGFSDFSGETPSLRMAGGEFCGNASLAAAALYGQLKGSTLPYELSLSVSGTAKPVRILMESSAFGTVTMPQPERIETVSLALGETVFDLPLVRFSGISHLIVEQPLEKTQAEEAVRKWCRELGCAGLGLLFFDRKESRLTPLVYVPAIPSLFWESSCASGSAAVGAYLAKESQTPVRLSLKQPAGILDVYAVPETLLQLSGHVFTEQQGCIKL